MATTRISWILAAALAGALALGTLACDSGSWFGAKSNVSESSACTDCHNAQGDAWRNASSHSIIYACEDCHAKVSSHTGPGHRTKPACDQCHSEAAHPPAGQWDLSITCRTCHDPHGSPNLYLVPQTFSVDGKEVAVGFLSTLGLADYSYADASHPGHGLCEICHDQTLYYNNTGTGGAHYTQRCTTCHSHAEAFAPPAQ